jgi:hypothetical protein
VQTTPTQFVILCGDQPTLIEQRGADRGRFCPPVVLPIGHIGSGLTVFGVTSGTEIGVVNDCQCLGPRFGGIRVYIDGRPAGSGPVWGSLWRAVPPGRHAVRFGLWWYRSRPIWVEVSSGARVTLRANHPVGSTPSAALCLLLQPSIALALTVDLSGVAASATATEPFAGKQRRFQRFLLVYGLVALLVCILALVLVKLHA